MVLSASKFFRYVITASQIAHVSLLPGTKVAVFSMTSKQQKNKNKSTETTVVMSDVDVTFLSHLESVHRHFNVVSLSG